MNCALYSSCPTYITERRTLLSTIENIDNNFLYLCEPILIKTLLLVVIYWMQMLIQLFSMQLLNMYYLLNHLKNHFFNENSIFWNKAESVNFESVNFFIYCSSYFHFYYLRICFIPEYSYNFRYLVFASFKFTVYDIYIKK